MHALSKGLAARLVSTWTRPAPGSRIVMSAPATSASVSVPALAHAMSTSVSAPVSPVSAPGYTPRYIDIGINLADPIFRGTYNGKPRHPDDLADVVQRAREVGCGKLIVTGSAFKSSRDALQLATQFPGTVYTTAGIHPCSSAIFEAAHTRHHEASEGEEMEAGAAEGGVVGVVDEAKSAQIMADLQALVEAAAPGGALVALGEMGLDYDRLHYCAASTQRHAFAAQLAMVARLAKKGLSLPLFLHSRACHADFVRLLKDQFGERLETLPRGAVVHSFTGTAAEAAELMDLGLYLGVNGCSLKTADNCDVVQSIRLDRLMLETDGPWCDVRPTHAGWAYLVAAADAEREAAKAADEARKAADEAKKAAERAATGDTVDTVATVRAPRKKKQPAAPKKEQAVPDRFKVVKKEKWEAGAMVKGRNEPCTIERIATIVAGIKGVSVEAVCEAAWANTETVFGKLSRP